MFRSIDVNRGNYVGKSVVSALMAMVALCLGTMQTAIGQVPGAVFSQATGIAATSGPVSHIAANSRGDIFVGVVGSPVSIEEIPAGTTTAVTLVSGLSSGNVGIAVDSAGNVYAADPGDQKIIFIPFVNGTYPSGATYTSLSYCGSGNFPFATQGLTTACTGFHYLPSAYGYYLQFIDVALDGSGNLYTLSKYTGGTTSATGFANSQNMILEWAASSGANTLLADNLPSQGSAEIAVDKAGDIYYVDSTARTAIQYLAAGSTAVLAGTATTNSLPATFGAGFTQPGGVSIDLGGNVYVTDKVASSSTTVATPSNRIVEFPNIGGTVSAANQYTLSNEFNTGYSSYSNQSNSQYGPSTGVGIDGYGKVYYAGAYPNSLNYAVFGKVSFGAIAINTTSGAQTLNVSFTSAETFGSFSVTGPFAVSATTCIAGAYTIDGICTVSATYTPTAAGPQSGTLYALDNNNNVLGVLELSGSGTAAVLDVDPGTESSIGTTWTGPSAITVDAAGNTYVADNGQIYKTAAGGGTPSAVVSGLTTPTAVAIDAGNNLYVAETGTSSNEVVKIPYVASAYGTPVVLANGLSGASGLALDALGNLYVADSGNARVLLLSSSGDQGLGSLVSKVNGTFTKPVAVAVDNLGNLYVSDAGTDKVVQIALATSTQTTILSGLTTAAGVAVDAGGSLYAADSGSGTITRIPNVSGALATGSGTTLATVVAKPSAIAVDRTGNLYAADAPDAAVAELNRTAGSLFMGTVNVLVPSAAISAEVSNGGTAVLDLNTPYYTASGADTSSFAVQNSSTCVAGGTVNSGASCTVATIFTPQTSGTLTDTLTFSSSNAVDSATLTQSGVGGSLATTSLGLAVTSPTTTPVYGQSITVVATVTPSTGPTGTVTFYLDSVKQTPDVTLSSGAASITFISLAGGAHTVEAIYNGNTAYASSNNNLGVTVNLAATTTSVVTVTPNSATLGASITMNATVASAVSGTFTGTVTFLNGSAVLASGVAVTPSTGLASYTTTTLAAGTYSIKATYTGDTDYSTSSSPSAAPLQISPPLTGVTSTIFMHTNYVTAVNSALGLATKDYAGNAGHLAANSRGDVFYLAKISGSLGYLAEIPANGGANAQVQLLSNLTAYSNPGVYADAGSNLWVANQGGSVVYIPFVGGTYATGMDATKLSKCILPISTNTAPCTFPWSISSLSNYVQPSDLALDGSGNLYVMEKQDGVSNGAYNRILEFSGATGALVNILVDNLTSAQNAQIAVDAAGDVYYANGTGVYYFAATSLPTTTGTTVAVSVGTGLTNPTGVSLDAAGNLYISDSGNDRIVEIPLINGTRNSQNQYNVIAGTEIASGSTSAYYGVAVDGYNNIYFVGLNYNSINRVAVGNLPLGATTIGKGTAAGTLYLNFMSAETFGSFSLVGGSGSTVPFAIATTGNTCVAQVYTAGKFCSVSVVYTATAAGLQTGTIRALDNSGNLLGQAMLSGSGTAATLDVDPASVAAVGSGWTSPSAIAVDASGNTYVADSGKIYMTAAGGTTPAAVASGFSSPTAIVIDGAGDLYVGDSGNKQVVEVPYSGGVYGTPLVLETGLKGASGLALDGVGNLYIADSGNARVLLLSRSGNQQAPSLVSLVGSGFTTPVGVAVDNSGNLYVSDAGTNKVVQLAIPTSQQTTILSGLTTAAGVAVDAGGSLYAADTGSGTITRVPSIGGVLNKNLASTLGTVVAKPGGIALDSTGNLYATDAADAKVAEAIRSAGSLSFGNVNLLTPSTAISAEISDGGTANLAFNTPYASVAGPSTSSFALQNTSTCTDAVTVNPGVACTVAAIFTPQSTGLLSETLTFSDNALSSGTLMLSGTGTHLTTSTLAIAVISPLGTPAFGQPVTIAATLTPATGGVGTPSGTVTFYVDTVGQPPVTIASDAASITLTNLTGGPHVISASYSGDINYASAASNNLNITIAIANTVTSVVSITAPYSNPTAANPGSAVTLSATITGAGTPTGTVTFNSGGAILGSGTVNSGLASFTTSSLVVGTYNITATYSGDTNFTGSSSPSAVPLLILNPTISMSASTLNITGGGAPVTLTFGSIAGFGQSGGANSSSVVSLACSGLPSYAVCSFTPAYVAFTQGKLTETATISVLINQPPPIPPTPAGFAGIPHIAGRPGLQGLMGLCLLIPGVILGFALRRARRGGAAVWRMTAVLLLLLGGCVIGTSGCGSSGTVFTTPAGSSTFTVTATVSPATPGPNPLPAQTLQFQLTVNK